MTDQIIRCPQCGAEIPLNEALTAQIERGITLKYEAADAAKEKDYQIKLKEIDLKQQSIEEQVTEQVNAKRKEIVEIERKKILAAQAEQTKALEEELEEKNKSLLICRSRNLTCEKSKESWSKSSRSLSLIIREHSIRKERKYLK